MGADVVGWRACPLQQREGEDGFFQKVKLVAYKRHAERTLPEPQRATVPIKIKVTGQPVQVLSYQAIAEAVHGFEAGIPECASCPLSENRPLGCYRYVSYPVPAELEESLTEFAERELERDDSPLRALVEQYLEDDQLCALSDGFRNNRGEATGYLASRPEPLPLEAPFFEDADSADLLSVLITPLREGAELALEADVLDSWLDGRAAEGPHGGDWAEWLALARLLRAAAELSTSMAGVAVVFEG